MGALHQGSLPAPVVCATAAGAYTPVPLMIVTEQQQQYENICCCNGAMHTMTPSRTATTQCQCSCMPACSALGKRAACKKRASACCCMTSASNAVFDSCPLHTQQIRVRLTHAVQRGSSSLVPSAYLYDHICAEHKPPEKGVTSNKKCT